MEHLQTIYRNYDIRGKYPEEISDAEVRAIGRVLVSHLGLKTIAIGRDIRPSGDSLFAALVRGITCEGGDVVDLGIVTTPMSYFACDEHVDATIMITASHMGPAYNGLKMCFSGGRPFPATTLKEIEKIIRGGLPTPTSPIGTVTTRSIRADWVQFFRTAFPMDMSNMKVVVDPANMVGCLEIETLKQLNNGLTVHSIYDTFDYTTPNHEANPIKYETLVDLGAEVVRTNAHIGVALDGDADRVGFVDENGAPVPSDLIAVLISRFMLERHPGSTIVYDLRSTRSAQRVITQLGGTALESPVGHINVRTLMREHDAIFGGEVSGHFFFKMTRYSEGGILPLLIILELIQSTGKPLSKLIEEVRVFHKSEETNTEVTRAPEQIYAALEKHFNTGAISKLDGLKIDFKTWWFNVRPSANDPVIRLNMEAESKEELEERMAEVLSLIVL